MGILGDVIAGCAPGEPDCAAGSIPPGMDTWFVVLVLLILLAVAVGTGLLLRRAVRRRSRTAGGRQSPVAGS
jgi:hypothetical protein